MEEVKPNFIIIGAPKCGTTSLYKYVGQHPDVYMSENKEPKFFAFAETDLNFSGHQKAVNQIKSSTTRNFEDYLALFQKGKDYKIRGEASPIYFHYPGTARRIKYYLPGIKMALILRNPVDRLYSDWKHQIRMGWEEETNFIDALRKWDERKNHNWFPYLDYLPKVN